MTNNVVAGKVVNQIEFNIDNQSWKNLNRFQQRIKGLKEQLKGLNGSFVVTGKIEKFTRAVVKSEEKIAKARTKAVSDEVKAQRELNKLHAEANRMNRSYDYGKRKQLREASQMHQLALRMNRDFDQQRRKRQAEVNRAHGEALRMNKSMSAGGTVKQSRAELAADRLSEDHRKAELRLAQVRAPESVVASTKQSITNLNKVFADGNITLRKYNAELNLLIGAQQRAIRHNRMMSTSFSDIRNSIVAATASFTAYAAAVNIYTEGKELESVRAGMALFAGNDIAVEENMEFIRQASMDIGVNFLEAAKNFSKFQIVARNSMSQQQSKELFLGISEYARVTGATSQQQGRAFYALQQINLHHGLPTQ
jgi:uncharacterized coiled-coil protein SlyX